MRRSLSTRAFLQLISVVLAGVLWFYVLSAEPIEVERRIPLEIVVPKGHAISTEIVREVVVKLKGPRAFLSRPFRDTDRVIVNLNGRKFRLRRAFSVPLDETDIPLPFGVQLLEVRPTELRVALAQESRRKVRVEATLAGELSPELKLVASSVVPDKLTLVGPAGLVRKQRRLYTRPIDLSTLEGAGEVKVDIEGLDSRLSVNEGAEVLFRFETRPRQANLSLQGVPIRFLSSHLRLHSRVRRVDLEVLLRREKDVLDPKDVLVVAEVPDKLRGRGTVRLRAELPDGVQLLKMRPESIEVEVGKRSTRGSTGR